MKKVKVQAQSQGANEDQPTREVELVGLADRANEYHWKYWNGCKSLLPNARVSGDALIEAKALAGHGNWLEWVRRNFDASIDTAESYMKIARNWDRLQATLDREPKLTIDEALRRLKEPRQPDGELDPPILRTRVVVEMSPAEEARLELKKWIPEAIRHWTAEEVIYLREHGKDNWDFLWADLQAEVRPLARLVVRAERRLTEALDNLKKEQPAGPRTEGWDEERDRHKAEFRLELLEGLMDVRKLNHHQTDIVLCLLGVDAWEAEDGLSVEARKKIRRGIVSPRRTELLNHLSELVNRPTTAPLDRTG